MDICFFSTAAVVAAAAGSPQHCMPHFRPIPTVNNVCAYETRGKKEAVSGNKIQKHI